MGSLFIPVINSDSKISFCLGKTWKCNRGHPFIYFVRYIVWQSSFSRTNGPRGVIVPLSHSGTSWFVRLWSSQLSWIYLQWRKKGKTSDSEKVLVLVFSQAAFNPTNGPHVIVFLLTAGSPGLSDSQNVYDLVPGGIEKRPILQTFNFFISIIVTMRRLALVL